MRFFPTESERAPETGETACTSDHHGKQPESRNRSSRQRFSPMLELQHIAGD